MNNYNHSSTFLVKQNFPVKLQYFSAIINKAGQILFHDYVLPIRVHKLVTNTHKRDSTCEQLQVHLLVRVISHRQVAVGTCIHSTKD